MRKSFLHRGFALLLAIYMPLALIGVPLHKHYCEGKLADIRVFVEAQSCHDKSNAEDQHACCSTESACHSEGPQNESEKDDCCDDEMELLKADVNQITYKNESKKQAVFYSLPVSPFILTKIVSNDNHIPAVTNSNCELTAPFPDGKSRLSFFGIFLC